MRDLLKFIFLFPISIAWTSEPINSFEYQSARLNNNMLTDSSSQNWRQESVTSLYAFLKTQHKIGSFIINTASVLNYVDSPLYKEETLAKAYITSPNSYVSRDSFNLFLKKTNQESSYAIGLSEFNISQDSDEIFWEVGRFNIEFGKGKAFNPINPFNYNSTFSTSPIFTQGIDGLHIELKKDPKFALNIYLLGDRSYSEDHSENHKSLIIRGDWSYSESVHINYMLGEDQNRHFYGIEALKVLGSFSIFGQLVKASQELENQSQDNQDIFHYLMGIEASLYKSWLSQLELGRFDQNEKGTTLPRNFYLPFNKMISWINNYRVSDNQRVALHTSQDLESNAVAYIISGTYEYNPNYEIGFFFSSLMGDLSKDEKYLAQHNIPQKIGLKIRAKF